MVDIERYIQKYMNDEYVDSDNLTKDNANEFINILINREPILAEIMKDNYENIEKVKTRFLSLLGTILIVTTEDENLKKAIKLFQYAMKKGDGKALGNMGYLYDTGRGVNVDKNEAIRLYLEAIKKNNSGAMYNLAITYNEGNNIKKDITKAIELYQKAIELGNPDAMNKLAIMYHRGIDVTKDIEKAIELYQQAIEIGYQNAVNNLVILLFDKDNTKMNVEYVSKKRSHINQLTKTIEEQKAYITELEYAPNGVGYQKSKEHFEGLAK